MTKILNEADDVMECGGLDCYLIYYFQKKEAPDEADPSFSSSAKFRANSSFSNSSRIAKHCETGLDSRPEEKEVSEKSVRRFALKSEFHWPAPDRDDDEEVEADEGPPAVPGKLVRPAGMTLEFR